MKIIVSLLVLLGVPYFIYLYAQKRNMNAALWFFLALFLPLFGWIAFFLSARKHPVQTDTVNYKPFGYRSGAKGKMAAASLAYLLFAGVVAAAASAPASQDKGALAAQPTPAAAKATASAAPSAQAASASPSAAPAEASPTPSPAASADSSATTASAFTGTAIAAAGKLIPAKIVKVVDGDTMDILVDGRKERIRLLLVDTPETVDPQKPVQPFGPEASQFAHETLDGKDVKIEIDVSERDKYGRLLCYLWVSDKMFNEMLLEKGLARVAYIIPPNVKYVEQFRDIQKKPQQAGIGIWSIENYAQEDGYATTAAASKQPAPAPTKAPQPTAATTAKPSSVGDVYYSNCKDANAAGVYNLRRGQPGYRDKLDGDHDGVACERR